MVVPVDLALGVKMAKKFHALHEMHGEILATAMPKSVCRICRQPVEKNRDMHVYIYVCMQTNM